MSDVLIIGVGNPLRRDDALGPLALKELRGRLGEEFDYIQCYGEGAELMDAWAGYDHVIIIDAVQSGAKPGKVYVLNAAREKIPASFFNYSSHAFGLAEAVELGRSLGLMPREMIIFGVEGSEFGYGDGLSRNVSKALPALLDIIGDRACRMKHNGVHHA